MSHLPKPLNIKDLQVMKQAGEKISCLTAYDAGFAALIDRVGIDVILVGDSLGMVVQGHGTTLPVTMEEMVYHCRCVSRGRQRAFLVVDLPFMTYSTPQDAAKNAALLLQQGGAQMVKLEGPHIDAIRFMVAQGIPVCGHLGLQPQSVNQLGGYWVQGKESSHAELIRRQAFQIEEAGAALLVLECVPASLAEQISADLSIPVIGIGAGAACDGQVLVLYDILDIGVVKRPRFSKNFLEGQGSIEQAIQAFHQAVKNHQFPLAEHTY